jgi:DNA-binding transcriptional LysR family regulator
LKFENIEEPRVLVATAHGGSLTAAAKHLQITPAAASAALKKLEARLGVRLFERSTRVMRITHEGAELLDYCERALSLLDEGAQVVSEGRKSLRGKIRVTASSDLTRRVMLPMLDTFLDVHPGIELLLSLSDSIQDVLRDQVDIAIRYGEQVDSQLVAQRLASARRVAVASPTYLSKHGTPQHPNELPQHECLSFLIRGRPLNQWHFTPDAGNKASPVAIRVHARRVVDDAEITQRWAIEGRGIAYKSEIDVFDAIASGQLVRLFPNWLGDISPLHAVLPSNRYQPARVRALVMHLKTEFAEKFLQDKNDFIPYLSTRSIQPRSKQRRPHLA